jgi:hypothetical protein
VNRLWERERTRRRKKEQRERGGRKVVPIKFTHQSRQLV